MTPHVTDSPRPEPGKHQWLTAVVGACLVAVALFLASCWRTNSAGGPEGPADSTDAASGDPNDGAAAVLPPVRKSPYLNTGPEVQYVGSQQCAECHADEHASYLLTGHSRSLNEALPEHEPAGGSFEHSASGLHYSVHLRDGRLWHRESLLAPGGEPRKLVEHPVKYRVGSGRFARTYVAEVEGFLVESPVTWYASQDAWGMSPGYDNASHLSFQRNVNAGCMFCHAGRADRIDGSLSRIAIQELVIGCERCHGPGSLHVARHSSGDDTITRSELNDDLARSDTTREDLTIVNPRDLPRAISEAVCHQCHLESVGSIDVYGRTRRDFRPGLHWTDFCVNYDLQSPSESMTVTGHVQQMHHSPCYQKSETLTCITCHKLHGTPPLEARPAHYREACYTCHQDESCKLTPEHRQQEADNDCTTCHMPRSATEVPHVAFTHHRIGIHDLAASPPADESAAGPFEPALDVTHLPELHRQRNLGLAYLKRFVDSGSVQRYAWYRDEAQTLLEMVTRQGLDDTAVFTGLAVLAGNRGDLETTQRLAEQVLSSDEATADDRVAALNLLANVYFRQQRLQAAEQTLEGLMQLRLDPGDSILLGACRERRGDIPGAIAALERILLVDPKMPETYEVLSQLYARRGNHEAEHRHAEMARLLRALRPAEGSGPPASR